MPWWNDLGFGQPPRPAPEKPPASLTAAAAPVKGPSSPFLVKTQEWQAEAWKFYDELGEFGYGVYWLSQMISRVRLRAGQMSPELDEPEVLNTGIPAEVVSALAGGVGGQAQIMRNLTVQLSIPGDCYLIGEQTGKKYNWTVRSIDEVRAVNMQYEVVTDRIPHITWSPLPKDSIPVRVWRPHARWYHVADSPARAARPILRELDLVNRHISAQYLSRLASAGVLILPDEITFPVREEFEDANDPFMAEWIEIAAEAIRTPGTASAVVPIPVRVPGEFIKDIKHIDFTLKIDDHIIQKREQAITRLATILDIPTEALTGLGKVNHWTAWQLDEGALKTHIAPLVETICHSLTVGYLQPRLIASGMPEDEAAKYVVWYDMSELAIRPDRSQNAVSAYDRYELSGEALRRETGFNEDDAPTQQELHAMVLRKIASDPVQAQFVLPDMGTPGQVVAPPVSGVEPGAPENQPEKPAQPPPGPGSGNPPDDQGKTPSSKPAPGVGPPQSLAREEQIVRQSRARHIIRFGLDAPGVLLHPAVCRDRAYSCPFTHAAYEAFPTELSTGTYECHLDTFGRLAIGGPASHTDTSDWISTPGFAPKGKVNGHVRV